MSGQFELERSFRFEAAHFLPKVADGHPCRRIHGHSYRVTVSVTGDADQEFGWVMDFGSIDDCVKPICLRLDHQLLNEINGLENPTSEELTRWLWRELIAQLPALSAISVSETVDSSCTYRGASKYSSVGRGGH